MSNAALAAVTSFAATLARAPWFAACGEGLGAAERAAGGAYVAALGLPGIAVESVATWPAAAIVAQRPDWSRAWWDAEADAQQALTRRAEQDLGAAPLFAALSAVTEAAASLYDIATLAMSRAGLADAALARVASGAAAQACHQHALALACDTGPAHLFAIKYRLFALGRWPLGVVGGHSFVF